jgi:anti-sigma factor RsiW
MTRPEVEALLPFLVNGTLEGEEREIVEAALEQDAGLRAELAALAEIRDTMQAEDAGFSPGEMGLARLHKALDREEAGATLPAVDVSARPASIAPVWRIAAMILLVIAVGQAAFLLLGDGRPGFELAGDGGAALVVTVGPDTTEAALRAILISSGLEIVGGPSALGLYELAPVDPETSLEASREQLEGSGLFDTITLSGGD